MHGLLDLSKQGHLKITASKMLSYDITHMYNRLKRHRLHNKTPFVVVTKVTIAARNCIIEARLSIILILPVLDV